MKLELSANRHYFASAEMTAGAVIVDARAYYRAFYRAALNAERCIWLAGWQFDSEVALLRGEDARDAPLPVTLLAFLDALVARRPGLEIRLLAWDYSFVYALEREWLQRLKFELGTSDAVRFEFDLHPRPGGSHHQKFVVVDGVLAFAGGLDICDARWDDRGHAPDDPHRVNVAGEPMRPNHEVQAAVVGPAAMVLAELFRARWQRACGETLPLPPVDAEAAQRVDLAALTEGTGLPLPANRVFLSATGIDDDDEPIVQIRDVYADAIRAAERFIYIETQYFTSRSIAAALVERLSDRGRSPLTVVVVLPKEADSTKEAFALGEAQSVALGTLEEMAQARGHAVFILCSCCEQGRPTFVHSKVLLVDDEFLSVGSANLTERSMGLDTELALMWHAEGDADLARGIGGVRASLLAEHAGRSEEEFSDQSALAETLRRLVAPGASQLRSCHYEAVPPNPIKTWIFDPGGPLSLSEVWSEDDLRRLTDGNHALRRELARR